MRCGLYGGKLLLLMHPNATSENIQYNEPTKIQSAASDALSMFFLLASTIALVLKSYERCRWEEEEEEGDRIVQNRSRQKLQKSLQKIAKRNHASNLEAMREK